MVRLGVLSEMLVLAAIARAERHKQAAGVSWRVVAEHLDLPRSRASAEALRPIVERLVDGRAITQARDGWALTPGGRRRLMRARRTGRLPVLPESPRHRRWRRERQSATEAIQRVRARLTSILAEVASHLYSESGSSEQWRHFARRLQIECTALARASECLNEQPEPDDTPLSPPLGRRARSTV